MIRPPLNIVQHFQQVVLEPQISTKPQPPWSRYGNRVIKLYPHPKLEELMLDNIITIISSRYL